MDLPAFLETPLDRRATARRFWLPALTCMALLTVAYVRTAEGTQHGSPWGYRTWAFGALAYSDILALHEDRGAARHRLPYLEDKIEYPVLLGFGMWWPSVLAPGSAGYFALTFAALALCALGTLWILCSLPGAAPWIWAASPALIVYAGLNWDLFGILPLAGGVWLWARGQTRWAAALLSLAVWTKFFPVLVLGVLLLVALRKSLRESLELFAIFCGVTLLLNLPFALFARDNWLEFFRYNRVREIEPSLYLLAGRDARGFAPAANAISAAVTLLAASALAVIELRTRRLDPMKAACALVCVFFAVNKVYSPQYWLWVLALLAFARAPKILATAISGIAVADYVVSFSFLHLQSDRAWPQVRWFAEALFWPTVGLRYAALLTCAAWAFSRVLPRKAVVV
jgi:hypothetical protein